MNTTFLLNKTMASKFSYWKQDFYDFKLFVTLLLDFVELLFDDFNQSIQAGAPD